MIGQPDIVGLEVGTFMGESAECFCENIFNHPTARFYCVDSFEGSPEHKVAGIDCSKLEEQAKERLSRFSQCKIIKGYSHEVLRGCTEKLDWAYCDAGHDSMNVLRDSVLLFDLLKPGGILVWDDNLWEVFPNPLDCPKLAIDAFLNIYSRQIEVIQAGTWQVCVKKI